MADRLVTIATFDTVGQAQLAKNALEAAGIPATLADEMTVELFWNLSNAVGGIKVQVLEDRAEDAVAVLDKELGPPGEGEVDPEELAAEAEAAVPEEDEPFTERPGPVAGEGPTPASPVKEDAPPSQRDEYARRLFFTAWLALAVPPLWFFALYLFFNAAFGEGPISPRAKYNLFVSGIVLCLGLLWVWVFLLLLPSVFG